MSIGIALVDRIIPGIGVAVGADGVGEPAGGVAFERALLVDRVEPVGHGEAGERRVVPARLQVEEAGSGVVALADIAALLRRAGRGRDRDLLAVRRVAVAEAGGAGGVGFELDRRQVVAVDEAVGGADAADIGVG